ncbi:MAG: DUF357 domain-containing protein [Nanoarchaeota archaeon]|nr:DUF357 domain-containing protein [Nanoarchaeota archaeon]
MNREVTDEKLNKYFDVSTRAYNKVKIVAPKGTHLYKMAVDFLEMAKNYIDDAHHFKEKGEIVTAFAALNYAHGWLDAGARGGLFDVEHDSVLFTVD